MERIYSAGQTHGRLNFMRAIDEVLFFVKLLHLRIGIRYIHIYGSHANF